MLCLLHAKILELQSIGIDAIYLVAIIAVAVVFHKTRAFAPTLAVLLLAAVVIFGVNNPDFLQGKVGQDAGAQNVATISHAAPAGC